MTSSPAKRATVVITSYQSQPYLKRAVDSALAQDLSDVRVVVVDDGSDDGSVQLLRAYGTRITLVEKENGGQASAWNASLPYLEGDVIVFLDGDDALHPEALSRAAVALEGGAVKAHARLLVVDGDDAAAGTAVPRRPLDHGEMAPLIRRLGPTALGWPPTSGNAWARSFLEHYLPVPEAVFRVSPDIYLCSLAAAAGPVVAVPEPAGVWRWHGRNASGKDLVERTERECEQWEATFPAVADVLDRRAQGTEPPVPIDAWRQQGWSFRLRNALQALDRALPSGEPFVLLDEDQWAAGAEFAGRPRLHLGGHGHFPGRPADLADAHAGLEAARAAGATHLVTAWPAEWWHEAYALRLAGPVTHQDENLIVQRLELPA